LIEVMLSLSAERPGNDLARAPEELRRAPNIRVAFINVLSGVSMRRFLVPLAALLTTVSLAACSSAATSGAAAPTAASGATGASPAATSTATAAGGDPCALITLDDAKKILDVKEVKPGKRLDLDDNSSCLFDSVYVPGTLIKSITVGYYPKLQTSADLKTLVDEGVDESDGKQPAKKLSAVGDEAYFVPGLGEVFVLKGGRVYATLANIKGNPEATVTLAAKLLVAHL
jgi:hypothetical protein